MQSNQQQAFCASVGLILNSIYLLFFFPLSPTEERSITKREHLEIDPRIGITISIIASSGGRAGALNKRQCTSPWEAPIKRGYIECCVLPIIITLSATLVPEGEKHVKNKHGDSLVFIHTPLWVSYLSLSLMNESFILFLVFCFCSFNTFAYTQLRLSYRMFHNNKIFQHY